MTGDILWLSTTIENGLIFRREAALWVVKSPEWVHIYSRSSFYNWSTTREVNYSCYRGFAEPELGFTLPHFRYGTRLLTKYLSFGNRTFVKRVLGLLVFICMSCSKRHRFYIRAKWVERRFNLEKWCEKKSWVRSRDSVVVKSAESTLMSVMYPHSWQHRFSEAFE